MGTRSLTRVFEGDKEILCLYRQFDGYKSAHGAEVAELLNSRKFVNGIGDNRIVFNGMGCFAAHLVGTLKGGRAGGIYLYPAGSSGVGEEFVYEIRGGFDPENGYQPLPVTVKCIAYDKEAFSGTPAEFLAWCHAEEVEDA